MSSSNPEADGLPSWFARPALTPLNHETPPYQPQTSLLNLFDVAIPLPRTFDEHLFELRVSEDDLDRWRRNGWIEFHEPPHCPTTEHPLIRRIEFVRDLARSGLHDSHVTRLLAALGAGGAPDIARVAFSFRYGWVEVVEVEDSEIIEEWLAAGGEDEVLDAWIETAEPDLLEEMRRRIEEELAQQQVEPD